MMGVKKAGVTVARGDQVVNEQLHQHLIASLRHRQGNYWVGLPCRQCYRGHYRHAMEVCAGRLFTYLTMAVVQTNRNLSRMQDDFPEILNRVGANVVWVGGPDHNVTKLPFIVKTKIQVPQQDAWSAYQDTYMRYRSFAHGDIVMLSCGPMATVLACEWFQERPDCTFIDIGSTYDPATRGVTHSCHSGKLKPCKVCN